MDSKEHFKQEEHERRLGAREERLRKKGMREISGKKVSSDTSDLVYSKAGDTRLQARAKKRSTSDGFMTRGGVKTETEGHRQKRDAKEEASFQKAFKARGLDKKIRTAQ